MTSTVKFTAHCAADKRLYVLTTHVDHTGAQRKEEHWLKDGESYEVSVYDSKRTHAFEVDASAVPEGYEVPVSAPPPAPPVDNAFVAPGAEKFSEPDAAAGTPAIASAEIAQAGGFGGAGASGGWDAPDAPAEQTLAIDRQAEAIPAGGVDDGVEGFDSPAVDSAVDD